MTIMMPLIREMKKVNQKRRAIRLPKVIQGITEDAKLFANRCQEEVEKMMKEVLNNNDEVMPMANLKLSNENQVQLKNAHLSEANKVQSNLCTCGTEKSGSLKVVADKIEI